MPKAKRFSWLKGFQAQVPFLWIHFTWSLRNITSFMFELDKKFACPLQVRNLLTRRCGWKRSQYVNVNMFPHPQAVHVLLIWILFHQPLAHVRFGQESRINPRKKKNQLAYMHPDCFKSTQILTNAYWRIEKAYFRTYCSGDWKKRSVQQRCCGAPNRQWFLEEKSHCCLWRWQIAACAAVFLELFCWHHHQAEHLKCNKLKLAFCDRCKRTHSPPAPPAPFGWTSPPCDVWLNAHKELKMVNFSVKILPLIFLFFETQKKCKKNTRKRNCWKLASINQHLSFPWEFNQVMEESDH